MVTKTKQKLKVSATVPTVETKPLTWDNVKTFLTSKWPSYLSAQEISIGLGFKETSEVTALLTFMIRANEIQVTGSIDKVQANRSMYRINLGEESAVINELLDGLEWAWKVFDHTQRQIKGASILATLQKYNRQKAVTYGHSPTKYWTRGGAVPQGRDSGSYKICATIRDLGGKANISEIQKSLEKSFPQPIQKIQSYCYIAKKEGKLERVSAEFPAVYKLATFGKEYLSKLEAK